jgi:signal transduction histidine kinase
VASSGGLMSIEVADTGPGLSLDPEEVFRPFRTTKDRSGGNMGLGLPVSRRIIRAMGGELRAQNNESGGALFTIVLPLEGRGM